MTIPHKRNCWAHRGREVFVRVRSHCIYFVFVHAIQIKAVRHARLQLQKCRNGLPNKLLANVGARIIGLVVVIVNIAQWRTDGLLIQRTNEKVCKKGTAGIDTFNLSGISHPRT
jgi:hypothetical protein